MRLINVLILASILISIPVYSAPMHSSDTLRLPLASDTNLGKNRQEIAQYEIEELNAIKEYEKTLMTELKKGSLIEPFDNVEGLITKIREKFRTRDDIKETLKVAYDLFAKRRERIRSYVNKDNAITLFYVEHALRIKKLYGDFAVGDFEREEFRKPLSIEFQNLQMSVFPKVSTGIFLPN
jgi:hypothetical protein